MANKPLKILACGDVKGQIGALIKRVETVNKKAGPFEMVLCSGQFFDETTGRFTKPGQLQTNPFSKYEQNKPNMSVFALRAYVFWKYVFMYVEYVRKFLIRSYVFNRNVCKHICGSSY